MIGLDANILLRYILRDDAAQAKLAIEFIDRRLSEDNPGFVSVVATVELVWVLSRSYKFPDQDVASVLERLLAAPVLIVENEQEVHIATVALKDGSGDFADVLIGALGESAGCRFTVTFDKAASNLRWFAPVPASV